MRNHHGIGRGREARGPVRDRNRAWRLRMLRSRLRLAGRVGRIWLCRLRFTLAVCRR